LLNFYDLLEEYMMESTAESTVSKSPVIEEGDVIDNMSVEKKGSRLIAAIKGVGTVYKFTWYTCLGTVITAEEKVTDFGKKMAARGATVDVKPSVISKRLDTPKAKISHASAELKFKAQEKITGVEQALDEGVNRSLHFMGVPSRKDMDQMTSLIKDMADSISELSSQLQDKKAPPVAAGRSKKSKTDGQASVA
jgi:Poly(hydroxyalcanoate) granule associated protein (phasin)